MWYTVCMPHVISLEQFEGPLDLLLQLIENQELDISEISLAEVTDQYVQYIQSTELDPHDIADFLSVAARLLLLKSKTLLLFVEDEEEEDEEDLTQQLQLYSQFVAASKQLNELWQESDQAYARERLVVKQTEGFVAPKNVTVDRMLVAMNAVVARLQPMKKLPERTIRKVISLREKIEALSKRLKKTVAFYFHETLEEANDPHEKIVNFLALLELVKQREAIVEQPEIFSDIMVKRLS